MALTRTSGKRGYGRVLFSFVHNNFFYVYRGHRDVLHLHTVHSGRPSSYALSLQRFDFSSAQWSGLSSVFVEDGGRKQNLVIVWRVVVCAVLGDCAYLLSWTSRPALYELRLDSTTYDLESMVWRKLESKNREDGPTRRGGSGMVACGDEALCVFGGFVRVSEHPAGGYYTDELHVFNIRKGTWSSPESTGPRPPPCACFSFTRVDLSRAVLLGGRGGDKRDKRLNEVHILDMKSWHWSGAILPSSPADLWPELSLSHIACALVDPIPFSTTSGSFKGTPHSQSGSGLTDTCSGQLQPKLFSLCPRDHKCKGVDLAWILDVNSVTWNPVKIGPLIAEGYVHPFLGCRNRSSTEAEVVMVTFREWRNPYGIPNFTTLFCLGVRSLYNSCVDFIAERNEFNASLLQRLLPPHIQSDIIQERDKRSNIVRYNYRMMHL